MSTGLGLRGGTKGTPLVLYLPFVPTVEDPGDLKDGRVTGTEGLDPGSLSIPVSPLSLLLSTTSGTSVLRRNTELITSYPGSVYRLKRGNKIFRIKKNKK